MNGGITSRLPPIGNGIYVSTVSNRTPPERSWSKFKRVLIDNPKDTNLLQRQKLWNFQKVNRGAFRSQVSSLPDIPFRVHRPSQRRITVGTQADFYDSRTGSPADLRLVLPRIIQRHLQYSQKEEDIKFTPADFGISKVRDEACSPIKFDTPTSPNQRDRQGDDLYKKRPLPPDVTFIDDSGYEYDSVVRKIDVSTMTDAVAPTPPRYNPRRKPPVPKRKNIMKDSASNSRKKNVKFADESYEDDDETTDTIIDEIVKEVIGEDSKHNVITLTSRPSTASSSVSGRSSVSMFPLDNMGHTSQRSLDPLSVLDLLTGSRVGDARHLSTDHKTIKNSQQVFKEKTKKKKEISNSEADRIWFEKIVGDKEVVDIDMYDSFARVRPNNDSQSDTDRQDASKLSLRKSFTPRINGESPVGKSLRGGSRNYPIFNRDEPPRRNGTPTRTRRNSKGRNSK